MSKFQLWSRDEYGQGSILYTSDSIEDVFRKAKEAVTDINVNNSLTTDDRERNWEAYIPYVEHKKKTENKKKLFFYGGKGALSKDVYFSVDYKTGKVNILEKDEIDNLIFRAYLGNISTSKKEEKDWFAKNSKLKMIECHSDPILQGKVVFFVKFI